MAVILKTFAGLNFYTRTCFIDHYHISFKKSHQTLRPRSCRVNQNFDISWILDLGLELKDPSMACDSELSGWVVSLPRSLLPKTSDESLSPMFAINRTMSRDR